MPIIGQQKPDWTEQMFKKFAPLFALGFALGTMLVMASAPARADVGVASIAMDHQ